MKIALVMPFYNERDHAVAQVLASYPIERELPAALAVLGHDVTVFHHAPFSAEHRTSTVMYRFVRPSALTRVAGKALFRWKRNYGPAYYQPALSLVWKLARYGPDVVHVFGMSIDLQLALVARMCERRRIPLVVHYHGGEPAPGRLRRLQRHNLRRVDRALFTIRDQARPWVQAGLLTGWDRVEQVVETSSPYQPVPRGDARARTSMSGDPIYLSVGRLHPIKDPATMLAGFARIAEQQTGAQLYLYYLTDELRPDLEALVEQIPQLRDRVHFRGRAAPSDMAAIYSSADFLLQASLREWSGLAVLEAMSCGCIPIVTDIPSFAMMTANGSYGRLFTPGSADQLAAAALAVTPEARGALSRSVSEWFKRELSFAAMAEKLERIYLDVVEQHRTPESRWNQGSDEALESTIQP